MAEALAAVEAAEAAERAAAERAAAERAAKLGLLEPLQSLALDADTLRTAIAAAVAYCDAQGAASFADLVERASKLIARPHRTHPTLGAPGPYGLAPTRPLLWPIIMPVVAAPICLVSAEICTLSNHHTGTTCSTV